MSPVLSHVLSVISFAMVVATLLANRQRWGFVLKVWRGVTRHMLWQVPLVFFATLVACAALSKFEPLRWSWLSLLGSDGSNINMAPVQGESWPIALAFLCLLAPAVPFLANAEERMFRSGRKTVKEVTLSSIVFGLAHCLAGVPLAVGLALSIPGGYYGYIYVQEYRRPREKRGRQKRAEREALLASTAAHTLHNTMLIAILGLYLIALAILRRAAT